MTPDTTLEIIDEPDAPAANTGVPPTRLTPFEHGIVVYLHSPQAGETVADTMQPGYWAHVARFLRPGYQIELHWQDMTKMARFVVLSVSSIEAIVVPLWVVDLASIEVPGAREAKASGRYEAVFRGPVEQWSVVERATGNVASSKMATRQDADRFIVNYEKSQRR